MASLSSVLVIVVLWCALTMSGAVSDLFLPGPDLLWGAVVDLVQEGYKGRTL